MRQAQSNTKGVSKQAQELSEKVRDRFVDFVKKKGLTEVAKQTNLSYQVLRNSAVTGYRPSLDTVFQVKLGYKEEFDEVYVFTGKQPIGQALQAEAERTTSEEVVTGLQAQLMATQEKLKEREEQISELKADKAFLQSLIKKDSVS
ncbi:MAG: hypothetical protein EOO39_09690 [Cytophagaceae bacterium]|nr:MAG: hypothetical protein EOO39_09690 [Cytophagaceae bacterium]